MSLGFIALLLILVLSVVLIVLDVLIASRKAFEPLWIWVLLSVLFPWVMLIVLLVLPARRDSQDAV